MGPWDPNWRPDPTGRRLEAIRAARSGALAAAVIFGTLEVLATIVAIPADSRLGADRAAHRIDGRPRQPAGARPTRGGSHVGRARDATVGGECRLGDGYRGPCGGGHVGDDRRLHPRWRHGLFERRGGERSGRWRGPCFRALAGRRDGRSPDRAVDRAGVGRVGAARSSIRSAGADDRICHRGPRPVVAQARTRTSSPRRMTPGRSTSPHTPNIRSLPSTWPRYSLIARSVS